MAYPLSPRFSAAFCLSIALLFSGCCANNVCNCQDAQADAIELRFTSDFLVTDLDTVLLLRYPLVTAANTVPETVTLIRTGTQRRDSIILNNTSPFAQSGVAKINRYRYEVRYYTKPRGSRPVATTALAIDSLHLKGSFDGNGCCTCYTNTEKTVFVRGRGFALANQARPILEISK